MKSGKKNRDFETKLLRGLGLKLGFVPVPRARSLLKKKSVLHPGGGGGSYSGFQVTGVIEWGQKWKPKTPLGLKQPLLPAKKNNWAYI